MFIIGNLWNEMKKARDKKVRDIIGDCYKKKDVPNTYEGIILSDKDLEEQYDDTTKEPAVYGGIKITEEIKEFLSFLQASGHMLG